MDNSEKRIDDDMVYCEKEGNFGNGFRVDDVAYVLACVYGEADESNWHWLCAMKDHTYAYATGGCDYTGWGCQDWGESHIYLTLKEAINALPEKDGGYNNPRPIRELIKRQLIGELAFGEATQSDSNDILKGE